MLSTDVRCSAITNGVTLFYLVLSVAAPLEEIR